MRKYKEKGNPEQRRRGQSTLEYMIILAGVVGVVIWAAATLIKPGVTTSLNNAQTAIDDAANKLSP